MPAAITISIVHYRLAGEVAAYLREHCCGEREALKLARLSRRFLVCESLLMRYFKQRYQVSIHEYMLQQRMTKAKEWMRDKNISLSDIANKTGYPDLSNFTRDFKRVYGVSPSAYRLTNQGQKNVEQDAGHAGFISSDQPPRQYYPYFAEPS